MVNFISGSRSRSTLWMVAVRICTQFATKREIVVFLRNECRNTDTSSPFRSVTSRAFNRFSKQTYFIPLTILLTSLGQHQVAKRASQIRKQMADWSLVPFSEGQTDCSPTTGFAPQYTRCVFLSAFPAFVNYFGRRMQGAQSTILCIHVAMIRQTQNDLWMRSLYIACAVCIVQVWLFILMQDLKKNMFVVY